VDEHHFKNIPPHSIVVLDDFTLNAKIKSAFLKIVNYNLRHHKIILFCIIHQLVNNNLFNNIMFAPHLFISYSNVGYSIMR